MGVLAASRKADDEKKSRQRRQENDYRRQFRANLAKENPEEADKRKAKDKARKQKSRKLQRDKKKFEESSTFTSGGAGPASATTNVLGRSLSTNDFVPRIGVAENLEGRYAEERQQCAMASGRTAAVFSASMELENCCVELPDLWPWSVSSEDEVDPLLSSLLLSFPSSFSDRDLSDFYV